MNKYIESEGVVHFLWLRGDTPVFGKFGPN